MWDSVRALMGEAQNADHKTQKDTIKFILDGWHKRYPEEPQFQPSAAIDGLVKEGKFGVKSGAGFYDYPMKK